MGKVKTLGLDYSEFGLLTKQLQELDGDIRKTTEEALKKSQRYVHQNLGREMQKHNRTYTTVRSLVKNPSVIWVGKTRAEIPVGFDISNGGLASIFLMYGTPKMDKDQALYNALFGKKTKEEIANIQRGVFFDAIGKKMGG